MAALVAGAQYGLSSPQNVSEEKSLVFVKLTDSALRAIEEFRTNKNKCAIVPTIQFNGNEGHLSLPNGQSPRSKSMFKFSLSNTTDVGPQGSFECIQNSGQRSFENIGSLPCKMQIQANDDVYEKTRNRMQAAEKQQKENCTREIELTDKSGIGRRVKGRTKLNGSGPPPRKNNIPPISTPNPPHSKPQGNNCAQKPGNPELMKRPVRERLIHLLAVRPYKKPEIILALNRNGIRERDKTNLMGLILSIATNRDNTYHLMRHVWNEVQEDWPFYTEQEKQILKRRKPENLTPPGGSDSQSPKSISSQPISPPLGSEPQTKRPGYIDGKDGLPVKKQRISHYKRPATSNPSPINNNHNNILNNNINNNSNYSPNSPVISPPTESSPAVQSSPPAPSAVQSSPPAPPAVPKQSTYALPNPQTAPSPHQLPSTNQDLPKYCLDYTTILNLEQRRKYKEAFNNNYAEYRRLHSLVDSVSKQFVGLQEKLRKEKKGSEAWMKIKERIMSEYQENNKKYGHSDAKNRFNYLHAKLSHIKQLVTKYDKTEFSTS